MAPAKDRIIRCLKMASPLAITPTVLLSLLLLLFASESTDARTSSFFGYSTPSGSRAVDQPDINDPTAEMIAFELEAMDILQSPKYLDKTDMEFGGNPGKDRPMHGIYQPMGTYGQHRPYGGPDAARSRRWGYFPAHFNWDGTQSMTYGPHFRDDEQYNYGGPFMDRPFSQFRGAFMNWPPSPN